MSATWKPVVGWEGLYEVSDLGQVRAQDRRVRAPRGFRVRRGHALTTRISQGRSVVSLAKDGRRTTSSVGRLVAEAFHGPPPYPGAKVRHLDGDGANTTVANVVWNAPQAEGRRCQAESCDKPASGVNFCKMHRERIRRHGSLGGAVNPPTPTHLSKPGEERRLVPGTGGAYWVSTLGRLYSVPRPKTPGGLQEPRVEESHHRGYLTHSVGRRGNVRTHVLVAEAFLGPRPEGRDVRHLNDDPTDARLVNLTYGTRRENMADWTRLGSRRRKQVQP